MTSWTSKVGEDVGVVATGVFEGVSKDGETVRFKRPRRQSTVVVAGLGKRKDVVRLQVTVKCESLKRIADYATKIGRKAGSFCIERFPPSVGSRRSLSPSKERRLRQDNTLSLARQL